LRILDFIFGIKFHPLRKIIFLLLIANGAWLITFSQYWQQQVNYTIDVSLNDKEHTLNGFEKIEYINNSPDTLRYIWFHIWPNAYKNDKTAFTDQSLENGNTQFYFSNKEDRGYINRLEFKVNDQTATVEDHPQHIEIVKVILPSPLPPGEKIIITTPFHVKLPDNFSRSGHDGQNYYIAHWYPKPAVYDKNGWHPIPMLEQGEFYSEFGNYDVTITLPGNYVVAATGELQNEEEKKWLQNRSALQWEPKTEKIKEKGTTKIIVHQFPESSSKTKSLTYRQSNVHDFAWFADKRFVVKTDTVNLANDKTVECYSFYFYKQQQWQNSLHFIKSAIRRKSELVGTYPYNTVSVVQTIERSSGGTEFPTITALNASNESLLAYIINHEIGHNWFYGILGTNEREFPWLDEGINSYYDARYISENPDAGLAMYGKMGNLSIESLEDLLLNSILAAQKDQPIGLHSEKYNSLNYNLIVYRKAAIWLKLIEKKLGKETFDKAMQEYYKQWQFKHPYPRDFKNVLEAVSGQDLSAEFALLDQKGMLPGSERKGTKIIFPLSSKAVVSYIKEQPKNALLISPIIGLNSYDKLMIGIGVTNYKLPSSPFQFLIAPLYSTKAKRLNGMGKLNYSFYPGAAKKKIDLFLNASAFSMHSFKKEDGEVVTAAFQKIVPGIRLTLHQKDPRSNLHRYIQWKTFLIKEDAFRISYDSIFTPTDTIITQNVNTIKENRTLHQLKFIVENFRALYPYKGELNIEQGKDFIRTAFTGNYFFNYPKGGGLNLRLFAGKFFYTGSKTFSKQFSTDRYHLNMTGPNGYEDYTYSDYFIGRNKFDKLPSQQIMVRDGGFKVRTDLYADKVGKTDDWLAAVNFTTTLPSGINPLSVLPVKLPLKLFLDIGTYADAWKKDAGLDRFVFDAGLQLSLFSHAVNIYLPVVYSRVYKDYIQSVIGKKGRIWKTISFSIDISNFNLRKINRDLDF
jgi:hypothetical protein